MLEVYGYLGVLYEIYVIDLWLFRTVSIRISLKIFGVYFKSVCSLKFGYY